MKLRWLHISDIHFQTGDYEVEDARESLLRTIRDVGPLNFVLFTGDLLFKHQPDEGGVRFLQRICDLTEVSASDGCLFMCPGNHDVDRDYDGRKKLIQDTRNNINDPALEKPRLLSEKEYKKLKMMGYDEYEKIYRSLTGRNYEDISVREGNAQLPIRVVELNTNLLSSDKADHGNISVMTNGLHEVRGSLKDDTRINILIMHHGVDEFREIEKGAFQRWLDKNCIDIVCCGHTHCASVYTYDETPDGTKQLTAGTVQNIDYERPSFFVYEYDTSECVVDIEVYTFNSRLEQWDLDTQLSRAFPRGRRRLHLWRLYRRQYTEESMSQIPSHLEAIAKYRHWLSHLNRAFVESIDVNIESARSGREEPFDAERIMQSLVHVGMPVDVAVDVVNRSVTDLIGNTPYNQELLKTTDVCEYVYQAICYTTTDELIRQSDINQWSSRFARRYWQNEVPFVLLNGSETKSFNDAYVKQTILPMLLEELEADGLPYAGIPHDERKNMLDEIHDFVNGLDATEFAEDVLMSSLREMVRRAPHPWFCSPDRRVDLIEYNREHLKKHLAKVDAHGDDFVVYQEVFYHAGAILMLSGGRFIGSREESPLRFFQHGTSDLDKLRIGANRQYHEYYSSVAKRAKQTIAAVDMDWNDVVRKVERVSNAKTTIQDPKALNKSRSVIDIAQTALQLADGIRNSPDKLQ